MKTYEDLYKDYADYQKETPDITEEEYDKIMSTPMALSDVFNRVVEYGRFVVFSKKWLDDNKDELLDGVKNNDVENKE